jgi:hypothetical protein
MSYPQDPQGWQPPGAGGYPQQQPGGSYPQQPPGYEQQPGGYNPGGGYGDPYAPGYQPPYDPNAGQQPAPPISGQPGSPPPAGPMPPTGPVQQPGYGYGTQAYPTSGYPGSPAPYPGSPAPYPGSPAPFPGPPAPPPKKSKAGLIIGIVAVVVVLICVLGGLGSYFVLSGNDPKPSPTPVAQRTTESPAVPPSPTADPVLLAKFVDPELRDFARNGAAKANECTIVTTQIPAINAVTEAVRCTFAGDYQVYYAHYKTLEDRDRYTTSARKGFGSKSYTVDSDTFWANDQSVRQGSFITAAKKTDNTRFLYWDRSSSAISAEVYSTGTDSVATETFWKTIR